MSVNYPSNVSISGNLVPKQINLAKSQNVEQVTKLMLDLVRRSRQLWRKEINDWQAARYAFYNSEWPRTWPMQELYLDIMLDGHLTGITENRTLRTTNKDYIFNLNGEKSDKLTELIKNKQWFEKTIEEAHKSVYFGGTLLWVKDFVKGEIKEIELIPRGLVVPQKNALLRDYDSNIGIDYSEIKDVLLYAQFYEPQGLLEKAAVYTILKRHSWGSWDEFEELFGVPIRIAKVASQNKEVQNEVAGWLEEMGSAAYGVFPIGTEVEIKESNKTDAFKVFWQKLQELNSELNILVLHQGMTTDNGSSRSQGEVHERTLEEVVYADEKKMLAFLNNKLVPAMRLLGYTIPQGATIGVESTADPQAQIKIDGVLLENGYVLSKKHVENVYGVEIESMPGENNTPPPGKE